MCAAPRWVTAAMGGGRYMKQGETMRKVSVSEMERWSGKVIDVRNLDEFVGERIERAECVPLDRLLKAASAWDPSEPVLVMCKSGVRSEQAARQLAEAGFAEVAMLEGGLEACKRGGVNVIRQRAPMPIFRQVMVAAGLILLTSLLLAQIDARWLWLTGFVGFGLTVGGWTGFCPMAKLLAWMPWNRARPAVTEPTCCSGN